MGPSDDDRRIAEVVVQMGGVLLSEETIDRIFELVTELTDRTVRAASAVSLTLLKDETPYTPHATDAVARELDEIQYEHDLGPCLEAVAGHRSVNTALADTGGRWPAFAAAALEKGFGGILSVPLMVHERSLGAINIYSREHEQFDETDDATATLLARQAAAVLANAVAFRDAAALGAQLREALESRDVIGQAKGILMERESSTAEAAFDVLRRASQRTNRKLRDVANDLVSSVDATT